MKEKKPDKVNSAFQRTMNSKVLSSTSWFANISINPEKLIKVFGKPTPVPPDTFGEMIFISTKKKIIFVIYDYKVKKRMVTQGNPWKMKRKGKFFLSAKKNCHLDQVLEFKEFLSSFKIDLELQEKDSD